MMCRESASEAGTAQAWDCPEMKKNDIFKEQLPSAVPQRPRECSDGLRSATNQRGMNFYIDIVLAHIYQLVLALELGHFEDGLRLRIGHPWGLKGLVLTPTRFSSSF